MGGAEELGSKEIFIDEAFREHGFSVFDNKVDLGPVQQRRLKIPVGDIARQ